MIDTDYFFSKKIIPYQKRHIFFKSWCKSKKVLDVGCVDHDYNVARDMDNLLHSKIRGYASYLLGVDYEKAETEKMKKEGFNVEYCDVLSEEDVKNIKNRYGTFDVIIAGELIEHLKNPGVFVEHCKSLLNNGGIFILTTPNPFGFPLIVQVLFEGYPAGINKDHKLWFDPYLFSLFICEDFDIVDFAWYFDNKKTKKKIYALTLVPIYNLAYRILRSIRPYFASGFIVVLKKK